MTPVHTEVGEPTPCSALALDLRGFTGEISRTATDSAGRHALCAMLAAMNGIVVRCVELALPPECRTSIDDWVHLGSTGDGAIVVFLHPRHHQRHAMLATLLIREAMHALCSDYALESGQTLAFGIGVESGTVRRVGAQAGLSLGTLIGDCINAAARVEGLTRDIHRTVAILCSHVVQALTEDLLDADYASLMTATSIPAGTISDDEFLALERRMVELNRRLCLNYLHLHRLRGFAEPLALFRVSRSSAVLGNPRYDGLLAMLTAGDAAWLADVRASL